MTCSFDNSIRIWNMAGTAEERQRPQILHASSTTRFSYCDFGPRGKRIVTAEHEDHEVWVWNDIEPIHHPGDAKLWRATNYCLPVTQRMELLGVSRQIASRHRRACLERAAAATTTAAAAGGEGGHGRR